MIMDFFSLSKTVHIWLVNILIIFLIIRSLVYIVIKENETFITDKVFTIIFYLSICIIVAGFPLLLNYNPTSSTIFYSKIILTTILFILIVAKYFNKEYNTMIYSNIIIILIISVYTFSLFLGLINS